MFAVKCRTNLLLWLQKICRTRDWTLYFYSSEDHPFWDPFQNEIWILCLVMCPQLSHGVFLTCRILHTTWSSIWADVCRRLCWLVVLSRRWFRICDIWCKLPIQKMLWCVFKIRCVCVCVCVCVALWSWWSLFVHHQLQVPSLSPSSSSWSWDREEDRRRQEKWQEEQERLLQVKTDFTNKEVLNTPWNIDFQLKHLVCVCVCLLFFQEQYQRDQERLEAEWRRAQQEAMGESCRKSEVMTCAPWCLFQAFIVSSEWLYKIMVFESPAWSCHSKRPQVWTKAVLLFYLINVQETLTSLFFIFMCFEAEPLRDDQWRREACQRPASCERTDQ